MISVDTNIIIRFLTHDDELQYKKALSIFKTNEIFITDTVILETEWVLRYAYNFTPEKICKAFIRLFGLKNIYLSNPFLIAQAIEWHEHGVDFSDALHLTQCQQYEKLVTFDKKFSLKANNLCNCSVVLP